MAFNLALDTVKTELKAALTSQHWHTELCNGRVTAQELAKFSQRAPGILLTILDVDGWEKSDQQITFAAFTLGKDQIIDVDGKRQKVKRGAIAEALALAVMDEVSTRTLTGAVSGAEQFRAQNLYSGGVHDKGAALWGITWKQSFALKTHEQGELVELVEIWLRPTEKHNGPYAGADIDVSQPPQGES